MAEVDPWAALGSAADAQRLCGAWLALLVRRVGAVRGGLVLLQDATGTYVPAAIEPAGIDASALLPVARQALESRAGVRLPQADGGLHLAYLLQPPDQAPGVVLLDLAPRDDLHLADGLRELHWGAGWLVDLLSRQSAGQRGRRLDQAGFLLDLQAAVTAQPDADRAGLEFVNRLAQHFNCHQVLYGTEQGHTLRLRAMSNAASFDDRATLLQKAAQAMNEAFDQCARTLHPLPQREAQVPAAMSSAASASAASAASASASAPALGPDPTEPQSALPLAAPMATRVHAALRDYAAESRSPVVCAQPLLHRGVPVGVCLLQRDAPFTPDDLRLLDLLATLLGPPLALLARQDESLLAHLRRRSHWWLSRLFEGSHPGWKLVAGVTALVLLGLGLVPVDYRVNATAVLEGSVQRAAVAPFDGFLRDAPARAGDTVRQGQVLALLEDKDLRLEFARWDAELQMAEKRERESRATGERSELRLALAQAAQARAQLDLARDKLARVQVVAPFDAVVVSGDLSQQLGSPVETGKVLFELAPLASWRVILRVDERDIAQVAIGRAGELVLASLPGQRWPLRVSKITPISVPENGRNHFRVEALLEPAGARSATDMRPGMEGVAKVSAEPHSLLWIWTHRLVDGLRLALWRWSL